MESNGITQNASVSDEETNPDMLKNTAENIQRLEDEIQQYEGRHKYLAQTRSPSDGSHVRWFFCKLPLALNELAASIPRTEVVGKGEYFRFGMRDSLAIEASFLQREEELLSYWWKEYAECSEGPNGHPSSTTETNLQRNFQSELYSVEEERVGVSVKGGLYEVDLMRRHCFPVYWNGENRRVLRGHWFAQSEGLDWLPLRENVAEQLEFAYRKQIWHRRTFQPSGLFAARVDLQGSTPGMYVLFTGEDDTWEAWLNVDASGFSSFINFGGNGIKLRRGYAPSLSPRPTQDELRQQKEEQMDDYCSKVPVRHLVFMVHGIGQRLEKSNLVDDVANFRHVTSVLAEKHLTSHQLGSQRVLFIPCQWRKSLKLSGESAVESITLDGVRGLRTMLSATAHDILYYMSPIYCQNIIDSVSNQLNRLYLKFLKRNPGYDGKVSVYGHSLGSVLSYDILCHQENSPSQLPKDWKCRKVAKEDMSSSNITKVSEQEPEADGAKASLEALNDIKLGRQHVHSNLENIPKKDPQLIFDDCPNFSSFGENNLSEERDTEMQTGDSLSPVSSDASVNNRETMNGVEDKVNFNGVVQPDLQETEAKDQHSLDIKNEETSIMDLMLEVDLLKARLKELEGQLERPDGSCDQNESGTISTGQDDSSKGYKPFIRYTKLEFQVDTFFAVGSPLGVFLALRNVRIGIGEGKEYWAEENITEEMPACRRMFNIFHPFDPVAYRVEPLVCKQYISERPVIVPYHKGGKRLHIGFQEFKEDLFARSQSVMSHLNHVKVKVLTICQSTKKEDLDERVQNVMEEVRSYGSYMMERLTGSEGGRIDHVLQDETFQHPYISAIGSHTNYWRDYDTALFILKHLYEDITEEADQPVVNSGSLEGDNTSSGWSDTVGSAEEELPLTFSNPSLIRKYYKKN